MEAEVFDSKAAARELEISERTLQKYAKLGRIRFETIRRKGTENQIRMYNGEDVRRVKHERENGYIAPKKEAPPTALAVMTQQEHQAEHLTGMFSEFLSFIRSEREAATAERQAAAIERRLFLRTLKSIASTKVDDKPKAKGAHS